MNRDGEIKPILLGRLSKYENYASITGHLGDVEKLTFEEYRVLKQMNGYDSINQIAEKTNILRSDVKEIFDRFKDREKMVTSLEEWNTLGWCENCHTYVGGTKCGNCNEKVKKIVFSPPCDPFICFDEERKYIIDILRKKFNIFLPENSLFIANNGCDENNKFFWEIVYHGKFIMRINFEDIDEESWKYYLSCEREWINSVENSILDCQSIELMIQSNSIRQKKLEDKAAVFLKECINFMDTKPLIYFSGGKESLVMLLLFAQNNIKANVVTVATGVDFPDDAEYTKKIRKQLDPENLFNFYYFEDDGNKVIDALKEKGILSANDPWCRVDFKKNLKTIATKEIYGSEDFVAAEGSRWYENDFRRRHTKVNFIKDYSHQVWIHPIAEWTSFDVWIYLLMNRIPINPVYQKGFQRTTCWLCPIVNPFHLKSSRKYYKELWDLIPECKLEAFGEDKTRDLPF